MEGQLAEHPLAELIAEISATGLSGALRLSRERIKVVVYFESGTLTFASSNLRAHRLAEMLKKSVGAAGLAGLPKASTDEAVAAALIERGVITSEALDRIREIQVSEVLKLVLAWTSGTWNFDARVRLADNVSVDLDISGLLLESARHLPVNIISSRLTDVAGTFSIAPTNGKGDLLPEEAFVLSRAIFPVTLNELQALSGLNEERTFRAIYGLSIAGYLLHSAPRHVLAAEAVAARRPKTAASVSPARPTSGGKAAASEPVDEIKDVQALFARLERVSDHYEVLNVARTASAEEIKHAYHALARIYHPDRFHQRDVELRTRIEATFARIAQAYEILSNQLSRATYDQRSQSAGATAAKAESTLSPEEKAESLFKMGQTALQQGQRSEALRFLSEAAIQQPREARYRAEYGRALMTDPGSRRLAESELQAAIALNPAKPSYRVMLAELYHQNGLRRRAVSELERALTVDPANESALSLLSKLKK